MPKKWTKSPQDLGDPRLQRPAERALLEKIRRLAAKAREHYSGVPSLCCPLCGELMEEIPWQAILINRCPGCQGVWLDPGALERLTAPTGRGWPGRWR